jgi:hypothetical protein
MTHAAGFENPYESTFEKGDTVRIENLETLESFKRDWKFHNPLSDEQLRFAGRTTIVTSVGFYHGGDVLYELDGVPGVWHEINVRTP